MLPFLKLTPEMARRIYMRDAFREWAKNKPWQFFPIPWGRMGAYGMGSIVVSRRQFGSGESKIRHTKIIGDKFIQWEE